MPPLGDTFSPILPRRLHKERPRVLMEVPHLDTFPVLVVYLHTKNQSALFKNLIPEWMRDIMHPLPPIHGLGASVSCSTSGDNWPTYEVLKVRKLLGRLVGGSSSTSSVNSPGPSVTSLLSNVEDRQSQLELNLTSIAVEITGAALDFDEEGTLNRPAELLNTLRENLNHIGYSSKGLWDELEICREIIRRAISHQANTTADKD